MHLHKAAAGGVALMLVFLCGGCAQTAARHAAENRPEKAGTVARRSRSKARARPAPSAAGRPSKAQQALTAAMAPVARADDGQVTVAVDDLATGAEAAYGGKQEFVTASIVKVDILATLLYQAQQADQQLSPDEQALATTMIENSNDDAASDLYADVGGAQAVDQANQVFGLSETTAGAGPYWGLTETTADDQIQLLRLVFTQPSVLTTQARTYIQDLMTQVEADQQWGIPAAADGGTQFMVKNGWLPDPTTGLWEINSIGEVVHDGQRMLIAVLSEGNATEDSGISLVQTVAETAAAAVAEANA
jgi:hypothetical protein